MPITIRFPMLQKNNLAAEAPDTVRHSAIEFDVLHTSQFANSLHLLPKLSC